MDQPAPPAARRTAVLVLLLVAVVGAPLGLLWRAVAPRADAIATSSSVDYANSETKDFITADALLFLLCLAAGLLTGVAVWRLARARGLLTLLALVAGSGLAAYVAWRVGVHGMSRTAFLTAARSGSVVGRLDLPLELHARTVLLAWPGGAALAWAGLVFRSPAPPRPAPVVQEAPAVSSG